MALKDLSLQGFFNCRPFLCPKGDIQFCIFKKCLKQLKNEVTGESRRDLATARRRRQKAAAELRSLTRKHKVKDIAKNFSRILKPGNGTRASCCPSREPAENTRRTGLNRPLWPPPTRRRLPPLQGTARERLDQMRDEYRHQEPISTRFFEVNSKKVRFRKALDLEHCLAEGGDLNPDEQSWLTGYKQTGEFLSQYDLYQTYGDAYIKLK